MKIYMIFVLVILNDEDHNFNNEIPENPLLNKKIKFGMYNSLNKQEVYLYQAVHDN